MLTVDWLSSLVRTSHGFTPRASSHRTLSSQLLIRCTVNAPVWYSSCFCAQVNKSLSTPFALEVAVTIVNFMAPWLWLRETICKCLFRVNFWECRCQCHWGQWLAAANGGMSSQDRANQVEWPWKTQQENRQWYNNIYFMKRQWTSFSYHRKGTGT